MFTTLTSASFLILILTSVGYNKPENYKRGILKTLFAWLLMTIAISFLVTNIVVSIDLLKSGSMLCLFGGVYTYSSVVQCILQYGKEL